MLASFRMKTKARAPVIADKIAKRDPKVSPSLADYSSFTSLKGYTIISMPTKPIAMATISHTFSFSLRMRRARKGAKSVLEKKRQKDLL